MNDPTRDVDCQDFVELVTEYLDDAMAPDERARIDGHLGICVGCATVLAQWRAVIDMTGRLTAADVDTVDPEVRSRLLTAFRRSQGT